MFFINYLGFICLLPFVYCFVLYPIILLVLSVVFSTKKKNEKIVNLQKFSFILPAYNEEFHIIEKLRNLSELSSNWPVEILVGDDGSTDQTYQKLVSFKQNHPQLNLQIIRAEKNGGKWNMLKSLIEKAQGDVLVMSDISGFLPKMILHKATEKLMEEEVAVYSPAYYFSPQTKKKYWEKLYWPLERTIKHLENSYYSTCGAHGACYFIKKSFLPKLESLELDGAPPINDDFLIPSMAAIQHQKKIVYDREVPVLENDSVMSDKMEYKRRLRIALGNFHMGEFLWHKKNLMNQKLFFVIFSHKILRSYISPGLIVGSLLLSLNQKMWLVVTMISFAISPMRASIHALLLSFTSKKQVGWT